MKFIKETIGLLKDTTWPNRKERWINFWSIIEYTAFFTVIIWVFDQLISKGIIKMIDLF